MSEQQNKKATWEALKAVRVREVVAPSGFVYKIKPPIIEHYAAEGHMPASLQRIELLSGEAKVDYVRSLSDEDLRDQAAGSREGMDGLIRAILVEPAVTPGEEGDEQISQIPSPDYNFLTLVAMRQLDVDAAGNPIYGTEPLRRLEPFRGERDGHADGADGAAAGAIAERGPEPVARAG